MFLTVCCRSFVTYLCLLRTIRFLQYVTCVLSYLFAYLCPSMIDRSGERKYAVCDSIQLPVSLSSSPVPTPTITKGIFANVLSSLPSSFFQMSDRDDFAELVGRGKIVSRTTSNASIRARF